MNKWERFYSNKLKLLAKKHFILDVGGGEPFQKDMKPYKSLFSGTNYYTLDMNYHFNPHIVGNAHSMPVKSASIDAVLCKAVLEHVVNPQLVIDEIYRICRKNGSVLIYAPFIYPYHGDKDYGDYYRFTKEGLKYLFRQWKNIEIQPVRGYFETLLILLPRNIYTILSPIAHFFDRFFNTPQTSGYWLYGIKGA